MKSHSETEPFAEFIRSAGSLGNTALKDWQRQGGKVIGYFCSFIPEEIIIAAGCLPFRMRGTGSLGTEMSDAYFTQLNCSFPRHCFNLALKGEYGFLDGIVVGNSCDHMRYIYNNWKHSDLKTPFMYLLYRPNMAGGDMVRYYRHQLTLFKESLEAHFGVAITDQDLWEAVKLVNETRCLQQRLYDLRKTNAPPITGAQSVAVIVSGTAMPKEQYNQKLSQLLEELENSEGYGDYEARVMLTGSNLDDSFLANLIEDQGGLVVVEHTCFGARIMWNLIDEADNDPLDAIAEYYVSVRPSCPRSYKEYPDRLNLMKKMVKDFRVDAVLGERLASCDVFSGEHYMLKTDLKKARIPFLSMEREYASTFTGQLRTRIQAFLESIKE